MSRLPIPGGDDDVWGTILNDYLSISHNADGTLQPAAVTAAGAYSKPASGIPDSDLAAAVQASIAAANSSVQTVNTLPPVSGNVTINASDLNAVNIDTLVINVKDHGATGNGVTNDSTAIQSAITVCTNAGGGTVYFPPGTYLCNLILPSNIQLLGCGPGSTILMLPNSANTDVIQGQNFLTLTGSNSVAGIVQFSIRNLAIDGNKANNSSGYGIRVYGYDYRLDTIRVRNCATDGIYSEWSSSSPAPAPDSMEALWSDVKVHNCVGNGIRMLGPHDSKWFGVVAYSNGALGMSIEPNGGALIAQSCHSWGNTQTVAWSITAQILATGCTAEGASSVQVLINTNDVSWMGGQIFAAGGGTTGIQIGTGGGSPIVGCTIITKVLNCTSGAVDFVNDGGGNEVQLVCYQTSGSAVAGTRNAGTTVYTSVAGGGTGTQFTLANGPFSMGSGGSTLYGGADITGGNVTIDSTESYVIGSDVSLYRNGTNQLRTNNELLVGGTLVAISNIQAESGIDVTSGNVMIGGTSNGLQINAQANGRMGSATLINGQAQIYNSSITTSSMIFLTVTQASGTTGVLVAENIGGTSRSAGNWFFVSSMTTSGSVQTLDTSTFNWLLIEPL